MAIRVAQIGTGNVGRHALAELITNPQFELIGVWVSSEAKAGKDAAELAGLEDSTGITATNDLDAVLADQRFAADDAHLADWAAALGADLVVADLAARDGSPRHDTLRLASAYAEIMDI